MMWPAFLSSLRGSLASAWSRRNRRAGPDPHRARLTVESLEDRSLPAAMLTIAALGDSLTAPYASQPYGAAGDQNWVEQLRTHDSKHLAINDVAVPGATSADLLAPGGQVDTVAALIQNGSVQYASLIVGANDVFAHFSEFAVGDPVPFVTQVVTNIETAATELLNAGPVHLVVGDIPDVTITPAFQFEVSVFGPAAAQALTQEISGAISAANQQIVAFAASAGIPVVDLNGLGRLAEGPFVVGGVDVIQSGKAYAPDFFHPGTVGQGILGNTILEAFATAYTPGFTRFQLTDQEILDDAGLAHGRGHTEFDVTPFVLFANAHGDQQQEARHDGDLTASQTAGSPGPGHSSGPLTTSWHHELDALFMSADFLTHNSVLNR